MDKYILSKIVRNNNEYNINIYSREELKEELKKYFEGLYLKTNKDFFKACMRDFNINLMLRNNLCGLNKNIIKNDKELKELLDKNKNTEIFAFISTNMLNGRSLDESLLTDDIRLVLFILG